MLKWIGNVGDRATYPWESMLASGCHGDWTCYVIMLPWHVLPWRCRLDHTHQLDMCRGVRDVSVWFISVVCVQANAFTTIICNVPVMLWFHYWFCRWYQNFYQKITFFLYVCLLRFEPKTLGLQSTILHQLSK